MDEFEKFTSQLEELGEPEVQERNAHGVWAERSKRYVDVWLRRKDEERAEARAALRDAREEETLSISKEASEIAARALETSERQASEAARAAEAAERAASASREQARWAKWAAIVATTALIISNRASIISLFQ